MKQFDTSLYFITDSTGYGEDEFLSRVEAALQGGVTILQIREKNRSTREYIALAEKVHALTRQYGVPLIIDDRVDVALAVDAEGVHLGAEDMTVAAARKILGAEKIIGATVVNPHVTVVRHEDGCEGHGPVPSRATSLLDERLQRFGVIHVHRIPDVGFVDAHAEGFRGDHDGHSVITECL